MNRKLILKKFTSPSIPDPTSKPTNTSAAFQGDGGTADGANAEVPMPFAAQAAQITSQRYRALYYK